MDNLVKHMLGKTQISTSRVHGDERCLDEWVTIEAKAKNLSMNVLSRGKVRRRTEGLEKERESVEIRVDAMEAHAVKYGDWGIDGACGSSLALDVSSNEGVPDEGFESRMRKVKTWVR